MYNQTFIQQPPYIERSLAKIPENVLLNYCKIVLL